MNLLKSLRALIFGETWSIPAGVGLTLLGALGARAALGHDTWASLGGLILGGLVVATLLVALRLGD